MRATERFCLSMAAGIMAFIVLTETGALEPYHAGWHVDGVDALIAAATFVWVALRPRRAP